MTPVFIGGCDRSGTTFLGSLLGAHSECLTIPEAQFKIRLLRYLDAGNAAGRFETREAQAMLGRIVSHWRFKIWNLDIDAAAVPAAELGQSYQELLDWLVRQYGRQQDKPNPGWWIDHTPANLRHGLRLRAAFPNAKFIHIVRDGRGVAASVLPLDWGPNSIQGAAHWWSDGLAYGLAAEGALAEHIIRVRYEDLVREPEATLRRLCEFCGLEYQPAMAGGGGFQVAGYTAGQHALVGQAPDLRRLDAWERELTPRQIEIFEYLTGDLLAYLGYSLRHGAQAKAGTRREALLANWQEWSGRYSNRWRYRQRARQLAR